MKEDNYLFFFFCCIHPYNRFWSYINLNSWPQKRQSMIEKPYLSWIDTMYNGWSAYLWGNFMHSVLLWKQVNREKHYCFIGITVKVNKFWCSYCISICLYYLGCKFTDYFGFQDISDAVLLLLYISFTSYIPCAGVSETVVLNMSTLAWSVVTSVQGRIPIASEVLYLCNFNKVACAMKYNWSIKTLVNFILKIPRPFNYFSSSICKMIRMFPTAGFEFGCKLLWWWKCTCIFWRIQWPLQQWCKDIFLIFALYTLFFPVFYLSPSSDVVCCIQVYVLKPSHKSTLQSRIIENSILDSFSTVQNATNATRTVESKFEADHEGKIREIVVDNVDASVCIIAKHIYCFILEKLSIHGSYLTRYLLGCIP